MFNWLGNQLDAVLSTYLLDVASRLCAALTSLALACLTIWMILYGWAILRNEVSETVPVFMWKTFKIGMVLAFALQASFYVTNVSEAANGLAMGVASTFVPEAVDQAVVSTPYALLDKFNDDANTQVLDIMKEATVFRLDLVLAAIVFSIGSVAFLCVGLFVVTLAKLFLTFVIAVGPLFVLCLAWKPTQRFFDSWLSMLLNAVVLTWFAFFALGLSSFVGNQVFIAIQNGGGFLGSTINVLGESIRYCVLMILMAIICFQAPSLAAGFTGGAVMQQGIQMIQNAMVAGGLRSPSPSTGRDAGGSIRRGAGPAYSAGRMTGAAAAAAARYASTVTSRGGSSAAAKAAEHASTTSPIKPSWMRDSK